MEAQVIDVWQENMEEQLDIVSNFLNEYDLVALDTEFPKFLRKAPRHASEDELYQIVKFNVDRQKLIQLGLALHSSAGSILVSDVDKKTCYSWQFNFREYNPADDGVPTIRKSGIDLGKNMRDGIDACHFSRLLQEMVLAPFRGRLKWITFHGIYDIAYIVKLITQQPLPETLFDFLFLAKRILGEFFDVKYLARFCKGLLDGETSLKRLSFDFFGIRLSGVNLHQAGYDSLLTVFVFWGMKKYRNMEEEQGSCILYGVEEHCFEVLRRQQRRLVPIRPRFCVFPFLMQPRPPYPVSIMRAAAPPPGSNSVPPFPPVFHRPHLINSI